jgi:hypothetical protein
MFIALICSQVVDMRWGVRDEATDDHMTTDLCLNEIDNCQRLSTGPNFCVCIVFYLILQVVHVVSLYGIDLLKTCIEAWLAIVTSFHDQLITPQALPEIVFTKGRHAYKFDLPSGKLNTGDNHAINVFFFEPL